MDLVALDPPAHARCEYSQYLRRGGYVGIQTKRGCPCKCIYCVYPALEGDTFRLREPADIADEIQSVTAMNSARYFYITDSVFNMPRQFALAVCDEMIRRGLSAKWTAYCNPVGLDEEMAAGLAAAGCIGVELGLDSACDKMLETMGKPFGCDEIRTATSALKKAGLPFSVHLLFGGPGETLDDVRHTAEFIDRCPSANAVFATVGIRIYPGTGIESIARQESVIDADTDLFEPTYYLSARLGPDPQKSVDTVARSRHEWTTATDWRRPLMRIIQFLANRFQVRPQWQDVRNYGKYFRW